MKHWSEETNWKPLSADLREARRAHRERSSIEARLRAVTLKILSFHDAAAIGGYHTQKPDRDNVEKAVQDGLNRIAWLDDSQVADGRCVKRWGRYAETIVQVEALG